MDERNLFEVLYRQFDQGRGDISELTAALDAHFKRVFWAHDALPGPQDPTHDERFTEIARVLSDAGILAQMLKEALARYGPGEMRLVLERRRPGKPRNWDEWEKDALAGIGAAREIERKTKQGMSTKEAMRSFLDSGWTRKDLFYWLKRRRDLRVMCRNRFGRVSEAKIKELLLFEG